MNTIGNSWEQPQSSDRLNLVFENRNKAYGAYQLRKNYLRSKIIGMLSAPVLLALLSLLAFMPSAQSHIAKPNPKLRPPVVDTCWIEEELEPVNTSSEQEKTSSNTTESEIPLVNPLNPEGLFEGLGAPGAVSGEGGPLPFGGLGEDEDKPRFAQKPDTIIYNKPDKSCQFLAYAGEYNTYVADQFDINQSCNDESREGYAEVRFMVDRLGKVSKVSIVESNVDCNAFLQEIERVFQASPRWSPAMKQGKFVNSWHSIRVELEF
jgi:protein TonB